MTTLFLEYLALLCYSVHAYSSRFETSRSRRKRIVDGFVPIVDKARTFDYDMVRYNAWIGTATSCTRHTPVLTQSDWWTKKRSPCLPDIDDQRCGGALIHPRIVQTAGHCVGSHFLQVDDPLQAWAPGRVWSVWEDLMIVFVGYTDVEDFLYPSFPRCFLLHPRYARLRNTDFDWVTHDYGWIILNSEAYKLSHWPNHVAPALTSKALSQGTTDLLRNQDVCLFTGYGAWQTLGNEEEFVNSTSSRYLRYGWQTTTSYVQCWYYLDVLTHNRYNKTRKWRYTRFATWLCHLPFSGLRNIHPSIGDSGSPVHCNGKMLALLSGGKWQFINRRATIRAHITRSMGLAFSIYENSANYREYFLWYIKDYAKVRQTAIHFTYDKYPKAPGPRALEIKPHVAVLEYHEKSGGTSCTTHFFLVVASTVFFKITFFIG